MTELGTGMDFTPGTHLLIEHFDGRLLDDCSALETALADAASAAGAMVLSSHSHPFPDRAGVTAFVMLAESHISIHTWPELGYAAIDIFMCGACDPHVAADHLQAALAPKRVDLKTVKRGG